MIVGDRTFLFTDATVNIDPSAEDLSEIACLAAEFAQKLELEPRVAFLSFSNFGSTPHPLSDKVRKAVELTKARCDFVVDGEMQADTAVVADIIESRFPFSAVKGSQRAGLPLARKRQHRLQAAGPPGQRQGHRPDPARHGRADPRPANRRRGQRHRPDCGGGRDGRHSSFVASPGHITHVGIKPSLAFGELTNEKSGRVKALFDVFSLADGVTVDVPENIQVAMWEKFVFICSTSGVGAVTRQSMDVFRALPETRALFESAAREVESVGRAKGVALPADMIEALMKRIDSLPAGTVASMQKDIMEGRPSELEAQTGAVIRMGRALGVPTPSHEFIYASLLPMELKARGK
jgi:hypothetical protein